MRSYVLGTRGSALARTQSEGVANALRRAGLDVKLQVIRTTGDVTRDSLVRLGGVGVFAAQLRLALLDGHCDLAVHSFKDLPSQPVGGLQVAAVPRRAAFADALCAAGEASLRELPRGASVGTGSPRRAAQLLALRPDLDMVDIRGNVPTRLARVAGLGEGDTNRYAVDNGGNQAGTSARGTQIPPGPGDLDAVVLALAGLQRLGLAWAASDVFGPERLLPAPAQGALAVEVPTALLQREPRLATALAALDDPWTTAEAHAERAVLARLEAGCAAPVGALARHTEDEDGQPLLALDAAVIAVDGSHSVTAVDAVAVDAGILPRRQLIQAATELGHKVGEQLLLLGAEEVAQLHVDKPAERTRRNGASAPVLHEARAYDLFGERRQD